MNSDKRERERIMGFQWYLITWDKVLVKRERPKEKGKKKKKKKPS